MKFFWHVKENVILSLKMQATVTLCICSCVQNLFSLGIYGVGKAAQHPPALAVLSHTPSGATQTIAWVGKGIVYDTGGLSIKGKVNTPPHRQPSALKDRQSTQ